MKPMTPKEFCELHKACSDGTAWAVQQSDMQTVWMTCKRDWLIWIMRKPGVLTLLEKQRFAIFCARQNWHLLKDARSKRAVEVAEAFLDGNATKEDVKSATAAAYTAAAYTDAYTAAAYTDAATAAAYTDAAYAAAYAAYAAADAAAYAAAYAATATDAAAAAYAATDATAAYAAYAATAYAAEAYARERIRSDQDAWLRANTKPNFSSSGVKEKLP